MIEALPWLNEHAVKVLMGLFLIVVTYLVASFGRKLRQLIYYRQIDTVNDLNKTYQTLLYEPVIHSNQSEVTVSLRTYLLDQTPVMYQRDDDGLGEAFVFQKGSTRYLLPKEHVQAFLYHLYMMHTYIEKRQVVTPKVKLMIEKEAPLLLFNLLEKHQWDELTAVYPKELLSPLVCFAVLRVATEYDRLKGESQNKVQVIMKDYGRGGFLKLAVLLPKKEQYLIKRVMKCIKSS